MELRDGVMDLSGGHQHPAQRVVSFWSVRREPYDLLEVRASSIQIALLQRADAMLVEVVDRRVVRGFLRQGGPGERHQDAQRRHGTYFVGSPRNQQSARTARSQRLLSPIY